jgi:hypothetical protein
VCAVIQELSAPLPASKCFSGLATVNSSSNRLRGVLGTTYVHSRAIFASAIKQNLNEIDLFDVSRKRRTPHEMRCLVQQILSRPTAVYATRVVLFGLLAFVGITAVTAQPAISFAEAEAVAQTSSATGELTPLALKADFDLMRTMLEEAHPGLYRYSTKVEMDRTFATQRAKLDRSMTRTEFLAATSEIIARIRCGHTKMSPDD